MTPIQEKLFALRDEKYAAFQAGLTPTLAPESFIGVRVPELRRLAGELAKSAECEAFLRDLPHRYYDENLLHSILLERCRDFDETLARVEEFLPYVDNWAVCDTLRPKVFACHREALLPYVQRWIASAETYTCRFGIDMLMTHYLDEDFREEYLAWPAAVRSEEYYVRMMVAWYYATALAKQWEATVPYIEQHCLPDWTHRKAIQKACESYRITPGQKAYLKRYRNT